MIFRKAVFLGMSFVCVALASLPAVGYVGQEESSGSTLDSLSPEVHIISPHEQMILISGSTAHFQWTVYDLNPSSMIGDHIAFVTIGGAVFESFLFHYGLDLYEWNWSVPDTVAADCYIRVVAKDYYGNLKVEFSPTFTIITPETGTPDTPELPDQLTLGPASPNPFNPMTRISFGLPSPGDISLAVYDLQGRRVCQLADSYWPAGNHTATWDGFDASGRRAAGGVYLVRLSFSGENEKINLVQKVVMVP
jgi:hypothetical protein